MGTLGLLPSASQLTILVALGDLARVSFFTGPAKRTIDWLLLLVVAGILLGKAFLHQQGANQFFPESKVCVEFFHHHLQSGSTHSCGNSWFFFPFSAASVPLPCSRSHCRWVSVSRALTVAIEAGCSCCSRALCGQREGAPSTRLLVLKQLHVLGLLGSTAVSSVHTCSRTEPGNTHTRVLSVACEFRLPLLMQMEHLQGFLLTSWTQ